MAFQPLTVGSKGSRVRCVELALGMRFPDDTFDAKTASAVKKFQKRCFPGQGKKWTGIVNGATWSKLKSDENTKKIMKDCLKVRG